MFKLNLNDKDIIMKIRVIKAISNKDIISNFIANLLTPTGGDVANNINMILTKDSIYIETRGHLTLGYEEETRNIDIIKIEDIKEFLVTQNNDKEIINIKTRTNEFSFFRL